MEVIMPTTCDSLIYKWIGPSVGMVLLWSGFRAQNTAKEFGKFSDFLVFVNVFLKVLGGFDYG